jgi:hypothetical protein
MQAASHKDEPSGSFLVPQSSSDTVSNPTGRRERCNHSPRLPSPAIDRRLYQAGCIALRCLFPALFCTQPSRLPNRPRLLAGATALLGFDSNKSTCEATSQIPTCSAHTSTGKARYSRTVFPDVTAVTNSRVPIVHVMKYCTNVLAGCRAVTLTPRRPHVRYKVLCRETNLIQTLRGSAGGFCITVYCGYRICQLSVIAGSDGSQGTQFLSPPAKLVVFRHPGRAPLSRWRVESLHHSPATISAHSSR